MGFPLKKEPLYAAESKEKLVNIPQSDAETADNVVKESPGDKKDPVIEPVNANVDKSQLGKRTDEGLKAQNTTTLGVRQGAGIVNSNVKPKSLAVSIADHSKAETRKYNFLVHCETCGWEGRYTDKDMADTARSNHIDRHLNGSR